MTVDGRAFEHARGLGGFFGLRRGFVCCLIFLSPKRVEGLWSEDPKLL